MNLHISIANYRCFGNKQPAEFILGPGLTAVVGINNAGKSALLRFFWEFRALFDLLGMPTTTGLEAIDYRLSDPYLDPPDQEDLPYSERTEIGRASCRERV